MNKSAVLSIVFLGTLIISIFSIVGVQATSVTYIKLIHAPTSTFMDPTNTYQGFTPGTNIRYHLYLNVTTTPGGAVVAIQNVTMNDTLPTYTTYVSGSQSSYPTATSFSVVGQNLIWNWTNKIINTVVNPPETPAGQRYEVTVEYNATVSSTTPDSTYVTNTAVASYNEVVSHVHSAPGTSDTIWVAYPILDIIKLNPASVYDGASFNYYLVLNNTGELDATGVNVTDVLPSGVIHTPGTSTASSGSFKVDSATQVIWTGTIGNITGTHIVTITIPVTANTLAPSVFNSASYTAYPSSTKFTHSSASCTTNILQRAVGGVSIPTTEFNSLAPWLSTVSLLAAALLLKGFITRKKKK